MRPYSQKQPLALRDIAIQGNSVRQVWAAADQEGAPSRPPLRRETRESRAEIPLTGDPLQLRLGEELQYARRILELMGDALAADPVTIARHAMTLQSLDIVGQMLSHIANIVCSSDPRASVEQIGMGDLKARLLRRGAL